MMQNIRLNMKLRTTLQTIIMLIARAKLLVFMGGNKFSELTMRYYNINYNSTSKLQTHSDKRRRY
jgi:hypothetical protein